jgi:hypothetical protein
MKLVAIPSLVASLAVVFSSPHTASAQCSQWKDGFNAPGVDGYVYTPVFAMAVHDDGSGPALFVGGTLTSAGNVAVHGIAKWDGSTWEDDLHGGVDGSVHALTVFDDGGGARLYAAGKFSSAGGVGALNIARWNGASWAALGGGVGDPNDLFAEVEALASFDDGSGPALFAAGAFSAASGVGASNIARWNGSSWSPVSSGIDGTVFALAVFDDGSGPALYAGGDFHTAGGASASCIAKWNGSTWSSLGSGITGGGGGPHVYALAVYDDGSGAALYVGGHFTAAGGSSQEYIAKWNGSSWSSVGSGIGGGPVYPLVSSLAVFDDGTGAGLYAMGVFNTAGSTNAKNIARWNGSNWSALGSGVELYTTDLRTPTAMAVFDDGGGQALVVGGSFRTSSGMAANHVAQWRSAAWSSIGPGTGTDDVVHALATFDDGTGTALYAGGEFEHAGLTPANRIAKWNGSTWSALASGTDGAVNVECVFDDGSGPALYAGGSFTHAGGIGANHIARWNGTSWSSLASGVDDEVIALAVYDDGSGAALYAGGYFTNAGGNAASHVAKWNGSSWSALGSGVSGVVLALSVYDDGSGPALYAGGGFSSAGGVGVHALAKWNGSNWSDVGGGVNGGGVEALAVYDGGGGPALIVGGIYTSAGSPSVPASGLARWNGTSWAALGSGLANPGLGLSTLFAYDDGTGASLYVGGQLIGVGGINANHIARWDGTYWWALDQGLDATVRALAAFDAGSGRADLYAGGDFQAAVTLPTWHVARWVACPHTGTRTCFGDGSGGACPCGNNGSPGHGCNNSSATGGALLDAGGTPSLSADTLWFTSSDERGTALSIFLQGDAQISPVPFGDGLRCAGGSLRRLYAKNAVAGITSAPQFSDPAVSTRSATLGDVLTPGAMRMYQTYYRDPDPVFCPPNTFNASNAVKIQWAP